MPNLTKDEQHVLRHTLGLDYKAVPFRNHFCAGPGHADMAVLTSLVQKGYMVERANHLDEMAACSVYHVTEEGKRELGLAPEVPPDTR
jgi:hypothetical protein